MGKSSWVASSVLSSHVQELQVVDVEAVEGGTVTVVEADTEVAAVVEEVDTMEVAAVAEVVEVDTMEVAAVEEVVEVDTMEEVVEVMVAQMEDTEAEVAVEEDTEMGAVEVVVVVVVEVAEDIEIVMRTRKMDGIEAERSRFPRLTDAVSSIS